jgi:hypothetical protein
VKLITRKQNDWSCRSGSGESSDLAIPITAGQPAITTVGLCRRVVYGEKVPSDGGGRPQGRPWARIRPPSIRPAGKLCEGSSGAIDAEPLFGSHSRPVSSLRGLATTVRSRLPHLTFMRPFGGCIVKRVWSGGDSGVHNEATQCSFDRLSSLRDIWCRV